MGVERTQVRIETQGEEAALAAARRVERQMEQTANKARIARNEAQAAERTGWRGLLDRARASGKLRSGGLEFGPVQLGQAGFTINRSFIRGGAMMPAVFVGAAVAHGAGRGMERLADVRDRIEQELRSGRTGAEIARTLTQEAAVYAARVLAGPSKSLLFGAARLAGERADVLDAAFGLAFPGVWGTDINQELEEQRARMAATRERLQAMRQEKADRRNQAYETAMAANEDWQTRALRGVRNESLPVGLNRRQAGEYRRLRERQVTELHDLRARVAKRAYDGEGD